MVKPTSATNPEGYRPPVSPAAFAVATAAALVASTKFSGADPWSTVPVGLAAVATLYTTHEFLRPFCCSFSELCSLVPRTILGLSKTTLAIVGRGGAPRFPEWTIGHELFHAFARALAEHGGAHIIKPLNVGYVRRTIAVSDAIGQWVSSRLHGIMVESFEHIDLSHIWIKPAPGSAEETSSVGAKASSRIVVLYYHGGGYTIMNPASYVGFANRLRAQVVKALAARNSGRPLPPVHLLLANYRKIPEHRFPAPVDDALAMYDYLVTHEQVPPSQIVMAGDSAGGGLVVATLLRLRDAHRPMPAAALAICPFVDMLADIPTSEHCFLPKSWIMGIRDICVAAAAETQQEESLRRDVVTANADLHGLPPLFVLAAEFDILISQSLALAETARRCDVDVELDVHAHMPHVFCTLPASTMPKSEVGIANLADFAARKLSSASETAAGKDL